MLIVHLAQLAYKLEVHELTRKSIREPPSVDAADTNDGSKIDDVFQKYSF